MAAAVGWAGTGGCRRVRLTLYKVFPTAMAKSSSIRQVYLVATSNDLLMEDPRNQLNNLSNKEWLQETKSFWISRREYPRGLDGNLLAEFTEWLRATKGEEVAEELLGQVISSVLWSKTPPRGGLKMTHPATFSEKDIERLIRLFTKEGELVLDPFAGSGSALIAARASGRAGLGIELIPHWVEVARQRLAERAEVQTQGLAGEIREGDARQVLKHLDSDSVDFIVTSPPYWRILRKRPGLKARAERIARGLTTHYSEHPADLGNVEDYGEFLARLGEVFGECLRVLRPRRYMCVIVSDFRDGPRFVLYHADLAAEIEARGFALKGLTVLLQDNKNLYPFAIPYAFVSNIHHQYILIFQKPELSRRRQRHAER